MVAENIDKILNPQKLVDAALRLRPPVADISQANKLVLVPVESAPLEALNQRAVCAVYVAKNKRSSHMPLIFPINILSQIRHRIANNYAIFGGL